METANLAGTRTRLACPSLSLSRFVDVKRDASLSTVRVNIYCRSQTFLAGKPPRCQISREVKPRTRHTQVRSQLQRGDRAVGGAQASAEGRAQADFGNLAALEDTCGLTPATVGTAAEIRGPCRGPEGSILQSMLPWIRDVASLREGLSPPPPPPRNHLPPGPARPSPILPSTPQPHLPSPPVRVTYASPVTPYAGHIRVAHAGSGASREVVQVAVGTGGSLRAAAGLHGAEGRGELPARLWGDVWAVSSFQPLWTKPL